MANELTTSQVCHALQLSTRRVYDLLKQGKLEAQVTPLGRLFSAESVEKLRKQREAAR